MAHLTLFKNEPAFLLWARSLKTDRGIKSVAPKHKMLHKSADDGRHVRDHGGRDEDICARHTITHTHTTYTRMRVDSCIGADTQTHAYECAC